MKLLSGGGTFWGWWCTVPIISIDLVNLSGVAVGGVVVSVAALAEMTGGVVPVAVVTDLEVSMCGDLVICGRG